MGKKGPRIIQYKKDASTGVISALRYFSYVFKDRLFGFPVAFSSSELSIDFNDRVRYSSFSFSDRIRRVLLISTIEFWKPSTVRNKTNKDNTVIIIMRKTSSRIFVLIFMMVLPVKRFDQCKMSHSS